MFDRIRKFFNSPAVKSEIPQWVLSLSSGVVVYLILAVFQPFNIGDIGHGKFVVILGFGLITFLNTIICPWLIGLFHKDFFDAKRWTNGCAIIYYFAIIGLIILGNFLYLSIIESKFSLHSFLSMTWQTLVISIFVYFMNLIFENRTLKENLKTATLISQHIRQSQPAQSSKSYISINGTGKSDAIVINVESLLYVESDKNYCHVAYLVEGKKEEQTIRATILSIESQMNEVTDIVRCHRAFLVNIRNIAFVEGNSGGYHLRMKGCNQSIPVSRSYAATMRTKVESL